MKVWIGYECSHDGGISTFENVAKVFDCDVKALLWKDDPEFKETEYEWREYREHEVE
jgi:hypothetical protein